MKYDSLPLQIIETGEGFLKVRVTFAVPGVLPYYFNDGVMYEAKLPEDILSPSTIESANGAPFVDEHPVDEAGNPIPVTSENYKDYIKGALSNAHVELDDPKYPDGVGRGILTVYDPFLISEILAGKIGVSMGFDHGFDNTPGEYNGVPYDRAQKNIRLNHLASTDVPRAGVDATKINLYGDSMKTELNSAGNADGGKPFVYRFATDSKKEITIDNAEIAAELLFLNKKIKADSETIDGLKAKLDAINPSQPDPAGQKAKEGLMSQIAEHEAKEQELVAQIAALTEQFAQLKEDLPEIVEGAAADKMDASENLKAVDPGAKTDGFSVKELRKMFISKVCGGSVKVDSMDDLQINAHYAAMKEVAKIKSTQYTGHVPRVSQEQMSVDAAAIEQKREKLTNYFEENQKNIKR